MYAIANIILGTYLPWDGEVYQQVSEAYAEDPDLLKEVLKYNEGVTVDDLKVDAENGELEWLDFTEEIWKKEYHGGDPGPVAWCGVQVGEFTECEHFPLSQITEVEVSYKERAEAKRKYDLLPKGVRELLPPFGIYVVWSTS